MRSAIHASYAQGREEKDRRRRVGGEEEEEEERRRRRGRRREAKNEEERARREEVCEGDAGTMALGRNQTGAPRKIQNVA
ncbi:MAG TPA: hypothetical protein VKY89_08160 [Thermoanaerobaculia bacterium]|nr:hypothetical protein [Thermoanaerobaculia bacterium]